MWKVADGPRLMVRDGKPLAIPLEHADGRRCNVAAPVTISGESRAHVDQWLEAPEAQAEVERALEDADSGLPTFDLTEAGQLRGRDEG